MDALLDGPARVAGGLGELSRGRLDQGGRILAGLEAGNAEVAWRARARAGFDEQLDETGGRGDGEWQPDDDMLVLSGGQQRCMVFATAERLMGGRRGSAGAAPGRRAR